MVRSIFLYHINKFHCGNALYSYHMSLILFGLAVGIMTPPLWYTIIKQMFYKENHHTLSYLNSSPYVVHEGIKLANRYTGLWELFVCVYTRVCIPWGLHCVCWVRGGQGFNKGTCLVQRYQSNCLGTCNLMGSR